MRIPCDISLIAQSILTLVILERESVNYHTVRKRQILRHCAVSGTSVCFLVLKVDRAWSLKLSLYRQDVSNSKLLLSVQLTRGIRHCSNFLDYCTITKIGEMSLRELGITYVSRQNSAPISSHCYSAQGGKQASVYSFFHGIDFCLFC